MIVCNIHFFLLCKNENKALNSINNNFCVIERDIPDRWIGRRQSICLNCFVLFFFKEARQQGRFAGFSLYVSNNGVLDSTSLCYKDGPQLPPLNFTTTCMTYGRYVTFYNERNKGETFPQEYQLDVVATELCEVIVLGDIFDHLFCLFI